MWAGEMGPAGDVSASASLVLSLQLGAQTLLHCESTTSCCVHFSTHPTQWGEQRGDGEFTVVIRPTWSFTIQIWDSGLINVN